MTINKMQNIELMTILKSLNTTNGNALIPTELSELLFKELESYAPVFKLSNKINGKGKKASIPLEETGNNIVTWKEEGVEPPKQDFSIVNVEIIKGTLQGYLTTSRELERDSEFNISDIVFARASRDIGVQIANDSFIGTNNIKGVLNESKFIARAINQTTKDTITYDELVELTTSTNPAYWENSKLFVSLEYYKKIKKLKNLTGSSAVVGKYFDDIYEIVVCTELDGSNYPVIFADWSQLYAYFTNEEFEIEEELNKKENISDKILRLAIGGKMIDCKAGSVYKLLGGAK